jgi:hypothetical protein
MFKPVPTIPYLIHTAATAVRVTNTSTVFTLSAVSVLALMAHTRAADYVWTALHGVLDASLTPSSAAISSAKHVPRDTH